MPRTKTEMFEVKYDWDTGVYRVEVRSMGGQLLAHRVAGNAGCAQEELESLKHRLQEAPEGRAMAVLVDWADWVVPDLLAASASRE